MYRGVVAASLLFSVLATGTAAVAAPTRTETREYVAMAGDFGGSDNCMDDSLPGIGRVCFTFDKRDRFIRVQVTDVSTLEPCAVLNFHAADGRVVPPHNVSFIGRSPNLAVPAGAVTVTVGVMQLSSAVWCGSPTGPGTAGTVTATLARR